MIKRCPECKNILTSSYCEYCEIDYTGKNLPAYYKFVMIGKYAGENNFIVRLGKVLKNMGHEIIHVNRDDLYEFLHAYEINECREFKKPISLRPIEYKYSPDIIFVEQTYLRYKNDCTFAKVIYHHREYTHFPDLGSNIEHGLPDLLLFGYPCREEIFDYYYPYEYSILQNDYRIQNLWNAVELQAFKPAEKKIPYLVNVGWNVEPWRFQLVNGPFAERVIGEQQKFFDYCSEISFIKSFPAPVDYEKYMEILRTAKAIIIDGGDYGWLTRRIFEAAACKTAMVIRYYSDNQRDFYKKIGLEHMKNCILIDIDSVDIEFFADYIQHADVSEMVEDAYNWVKDHTYIKRAKKLLDMIFQNGWGIDPQ